MGIVVQRYVGSARAPLQAREQLSLGLHADFVGLVGLALAVLIAGVAVLLASRRQRVETRTSEVASAGS